MQGTNRFMDFANEIMARHRGLGLGFEPAAMLYLEDQGKNPEEQINVQPNYTTNLYHIQNIREENYLFKQNLTFLTRILENKMYQNLYPTVEKQIEHVIREEMPQAEAKVIRSVSEQLTKLVQQGGVEQFQIVREKVFSEYKETTKETEKERWKEQEKLFRKIENIWNSSIYTQTVQKKDEKIVVQNKGNSLIENRWNVHTGQQFQVQQHFQNAQTVVHNDPIQQSEIVHPEIQQPEMVHPEIAQPEMVHPEIAQPEIVHPEIAQPKIVHPEIAQSEIAHPEIVKTERSSSKRLLSESRSTETIHSEVHRAETKLSKLQQLNDGQTVMLQPEMANPDVTQAVLTSVETLSTEIVQAQREVNQETVLESVLERTLRIVEAQNQSITHVRNQTVGNLGTLYKTMIQPAIIERIQESQTRVPDSKGSVIHSHAMGQIPLEYPMVLPKPLSSEQKVIVNQEAIHLEYPSEENAQIHQEMMKLLHSEMQRIPEIPQVVKERGEVLTEATEQFRTRMVERTKTISEQILSRMETIIRLPVAQTETIKDSKEILVTKSVTKTVALNRLSHAILEYAEAEISSEQLQTNMLQILEDYRTELVSTAGADRTHVIYNNQAEIITKETLKNRTNQRLLQSVVNQGKTSTTVSMQSLEPAPIVYRLEDTESTEQSEKTKQLEQQVHEVVKTIKNVEEKTVVQKERIIEEQRKVVQEILNESPTIWTEGKGAGVVRNEVQQSVEEQMNASVNQIANRVYRRLEEKLKSERGRRGLI